MTDGRPPALPVSGPKTSSVPRGYRILYSAQSKVFKIQHKAFFFFWMDFDQNMFFTIEEVFEYMRTKLRAYDWEEII